LEKQKSTTLDICLEIATLIAVTNVSEGGKLFFSIYKQTD